MLALYVGALSPVGLGLTALLGAVDPDHRVTMQTGAAGSRVGLHHGGNCAEHQHGLVARALTLFAAPGRAGEPDHVLQFSAADSFSRQSQVIAPAPAQLESPALLAIETPLWSQREAFLSSVPTHPPPFAAGQWLALHSSPLLI